MGSYLLELEASQKWRKGERRGPFGSAYRGQWSVPCAAVQGPEGSSEIRKYKEISYFLFFLSIWFIQHNQAIPSLDTACPSPFTGQSLVMGSLDKKIFLQAVRHKELEQNEMLWPDYLLFPLF